MKKVLIITLAIILIASLFILTGCSQKDSDRDDGKSTSTKNIVNIEGTNVPSPESVLGYEKPFVKNDFLNEDGTYFAGYSESGMDGHNSKIKSSDYDTYSKVLIEKGFTLENTSKEDDSTIYDYNSTESSVQLKISSTSFGITITKK